MDAQDKRYSLIRLIVNAGLEEDLVKWLNDKGYHDFYGRLDNIPLNLIEEYVKDRKLIDDDEYDREIIREIYSIDYDEKRGYIKARKH